MHIAHIVPRLESKYGGPSRSVPLLVRALRDVIQGKVDLLTIQDGSDNPGDISDALRFQAGALRRLSTSAHLRRHLNETSYDLIHHHGVWLRTLHYAEQSSANRNAALVISPRGMFDPWALRHHSWRKKASSLFVHPRAFDRAAGWHATSELEASHIRNLGFHQPICIAPNGIDIPNHGELKASQSFWTARLPWSEGSPLALFYGRFHSKKRVLELMDLWLSRDRCPWKLLIVGLPEEYTVETLRQRIRNSERRDSIHIEDGSGKPPPYGVARLFLLGSHGENFGLTIAEALAWGVPALVTDTTPWRKLSETGSGWCVNWKDFPETLAGALKTSTDSLNAMGNNAISWMRRDFSWSAAAATLRDFYADLRSVG